jgi:hypothetical protein
MSVTVRRAAPPRRPAGVPAWIPFAAVGGLAVVAAGLWIGIEPKSEPPPKPKPVTKGPPPIVEPPDAAPEPPLPEPPVSEPPVSEPPPDPVPKPQVPEGPAPVLTVNAHRGAVSALGFGPDGRQLVTGGADGVVKVWKIPAAEPAVRLDFSARSVAGVEWRTPERLFVGLGDGAIVQIDGTNPTAGQVRLYQAHAGPVTSVIEYGEGGCGGNAACRHGGGPPAGKARSVRWKVGIRPGPARGGPTATAVPGLAPPARASRGVGSSQSPPRDRSIASASNEARRVAGRLQPPCPGSRRRRGRPAASGRRSRRRATAALRRRRTGPGARRTAPRARDFRNSRKTPN